jgi:ATP-dependent protease Clp ATPase subunit
MTDNAHNITAHREHIYCNFCGLHDGEVKRMAVGRGSAICYDCVEVANGMFDAADRSDEVR